MFITDALATGLVLAGGVVFVSSDLGADDFKRAARLFVPGYAVYLLGGPTHHALRGRWGIAAASFGLRVGAIPASAQAMGVVLLGATGNPYGVLAGAGFGAVIGVPIGAALDNVLFAKAYTPRARRRHAVTQLHLIPSFDGQIGSLTFAGAW
jgi:hypothetical protein